MIANDNDLINPEVQEILDDLASPNLLLARIGMLANQANETVDTDRYYELLEKLLVTVDQLRSQEFFDKVDFDDTVEEPKKPVLTLVVNTD